MDGAPTPFAAPVGARLIAPNLARSLGACVVALWVLVLPAAAEILCEANVTPSGTAGDIAVEHRSAGIDTSGSAPAILLDRPGASAVTMRFALSKPPDAGQHVFLVLDMASEAAPRGLAPRTYGIRVNGTELGQWTHHVDQYHLYGHDVTSLVKPGENEIVLALASGSLVDVRIRYIAITQSASASFVEPQIERFRLGLRASRIPLIAALLVTCATLCTVIYYRDWRLRRREIRSAQIHAIIVCGGLAYLSVLAVYGVTLLSIAGGFAAVIGVVGLIFLLNR